MLVFLAEVLAVESHQLAGLNAAVLVGVDALEHHCQSLPLLLAYLRKGKVVLDYRNQVVAALVSLQQLQVAGGVGGKVAADWQLLEPGMCECLLGRKPPIDASVQQRDDQSACIHRNILPVVF